MSLIKCPECGREISDKAVACPGCGCPSSEWRPVAQIPVPWPVSPPAEQLEDSIPLPKPVQQRLADLISPDVEFDLVRKGYSISDTDELIDAIFAEGSTLSASQVSGWSLDTERRGYDMHQVDAYLDRVVSALTALGRV